MDANLVEKIKYLLIENNIEYAAVFGSRVRGDSRPDSDYDILVRFKKDKEPSFFRYMEIEERLSEILKQKVDLVTQDSLSPYIKDYVLRDLQVIFQ